MTLAELRTELRDVLNEASAGFWSDAQLTRAINHGRRRLNALILASKSDFFTISQTFATVASTKSYALPTGFRRLRRLEHYSLTDPSEIAVVTELPFPTTEGASDWPFTDTGKPEHYVVRGAQFDLYPIPDAVYPMRIYDEQPNDPLVAEADVPTAPLDYHDLIVLYAAQWALLKNSEPSEEFRTLATPREAALRLELGERQGEPAPHAIGYLEGMT